jgi:ankyrin repeat protein
LQALLAAGAEPDAFNVSGAAPLHLAASKAALPAVQLLLAAGADPIIRNAKGWGPVHVAASGGSLDVVLKLVAGRHWSQVENKRQQVVAQCAACLLVCLSVLLMVNKAGGWCLGQSGCISRKRVWICVARGSSLYPRFKQFLQFSVPVCFV